MSMAENDGAKTSQDDASTGATEDQSTGEMPGASGTADDQTGQADEEVTVTIGEESPPSNEEENRAPDWVRELRKADREKARRIRELEQEKAEREAALKPKDALPKPTLADCDYDEEAFESKLTAWHKQQDQIKAEQQAKADAEKKAAEAWQATLANHDKAKAALKVSDYEDAEAAISEVLSVTQRAIIVSGADNSAIVEYALGKNPAKAKELASITDPVKFAFAIAKLETQLKVTPRKAPPPPDKQVRGSAPVLGGGDETLERLRAEAEKTGDHSKVFAYKQKKRAA